MQELERILIGLDTWPLSFISRANLGALVPPIYRLLSGGESSIWVALLALILVLVGLRVGSTLMRRALPFSQSARNIWSERRRLAIRNDSYAWAKLFPMAFGIMTYALLRSGLDTGELTVAAFCFICGGAGEVLWRQSSSIQRA